MAGKLIIALSVLAFCVGSMSCRKLETGPAESSKGRLSVEPAPFIDAIPADYGHLVGVSPSDEGWTMLWFEKADKTIVIVGVHPRKNKMLDQVKIILRK